MAGNKIGILTFHQVDNPGAVLQAYALQHRIGAITSDTVEILDYRSVNLRKSYRCICWKSMKSFHGTISEFLSAPIRLKKTRRFIKFRRVFLKCSEQVDRQSIGLIESEYDTFLVGSDQVWNPKYVQSDPAFLLDFVKEEKRKYSYASSFGLGGLPPSQQLIYKTLLPRFRHISVREQDGAQIVWEMAQVKAEVLIDPTLLLDAKHWSNIAGGPHHTRPYMPYILIYLASYSPSAIRFACTLARKHHMQVVFLNDMLVKKAPVVYKRAVGPQAWVRYFLDAAYVVTNSFHGIVFSINLNKQFFAERLGNGHDVNSRIDHVMALFGLQDRFIGDRTGNEEVSPIEYTAVNKKLEEERARATAYLERIMLERAGDGKKDA